MTAKPLSTGITDLGFREALEGNLEVHVVDLGAITLRLVELVHTYVDWLPTAGAGVNGRARMRNDAQESWYTGGSASKCTRC